MEKINKSFEEEYSELLEFILEQHEHSLNIYAELLSKKNELEYNKRHLEYLLDEHEKNRTPNISMFSPLNVEDVYDHDVVCKDDIECIQSQLSQTETECQNQKKICTSFERLKNFFINYEKNIQKNALSTDNNISDYSSKLLETQEMDRNRIARDLHDSTVQSLTSLIHKTEFCSKLVDKDPVRVKLELQTMIDLNKEIINDMREIIYDLRPMSLNNFGLVPTIESYCLYLRRNYNKDIVFSVDGNKRDLSSIVSVTLYRIVQEACNNAIRHSNAKKISIHITYFEKNMELTIDDDGIGFDLAKVSDETNTDDLHGFGLSTMRDRANLLSGSFVINSKPGFGTKIQVVVPVTYTSGNEEII